MRRDYFTLQVRAVDWFEADGEPTLPQLRIRYEGPSEVLLAGFKRGDNLIQADQVDVGYRLQDPLEDPDATGVLSLTDRQTGEFLLELNATADTIVDFLRAARRYGEIVSDSHGRYRVDIQLGDQDLVSFDKRSLLVYNADGTLLRRHSLIPSGVEL